MRSTLGFVALATLLAVPAQAQVMITEVQPNPNGSDNAEWIEIHNTGSAAVDVSGWRINDFGPSVPREYVFPMATSLAAGQVIIIARQAGAFSTMANLESYAVTTAHWEFAEGADDMAVPNLTVLVAGTGGLALGNSGDGVQLRDLAGTVVSTAEWGNGRNEVPGNPAAGPASGQTIGRVANTGSSDVDFVVLATPTPGTGFAGTMPIPPAISGEMRSPATFAHGGTFGLDANIVDADGVSTAQVFFATSGSPTGPADGAYVGVNLTGAMNTYSVGNLAVGAPATGLNFPAPTAFNQRYIRYYFEATDTAMTTGTAPAMATSAASNPNYYWENVLPPTAVTPIQTARAQDAQEMPLWDGHSVRVQGVALTTTESFINGRANFFIADGSMGAVEAIRIFDDELPMTAINPGDVVTVTGKVGIFRGVRQIGRDERGGVDVTGPEITVTVSGTAPVPMQTVSIGTLLGSGELYESSLVEIVNATFVGGAPANWPSDGNVDITDGTGTLTVRVIGVTDVANAVAPTTAFTLRGIFTQFAPGGTGGYQLQPRSLADVLTGMPPVDGGTPMDAGMPMDGGMVGMDAGSPDVPPAPDGGMMMPDGGMMMPDGGMMMPDGGMMMPDGGMMMPDTGMPRPDADVPPDTGTMAPDAGMSTPDSGQQPFDDAGVGSPDSGSSPADSGTFGGGGGGGGGSRDSGGCTCATPTETPWSALAWVLPAGLLFVRRRRR